tara:strand:- start:163 stop:282 length:120 start_codon:yes stop_codon:yes gene_type:complete
MKKYTNTILIGVYGLGVALMLVTLVIVRFRLDRLVELTV